MMFGNGQCRGFFVLAGVLSFVVRVVSSSLPRRFTLCLPLLSSPRGYQYRLFLPGGKKGALLVPRTNNGPANFRHSETGIPRTIVSNVDVMVMCGKWYKARWMSK